MLDFIFQKSDGDAFNGRTTIMPEAEDTTDPHLQIHFFLTALDAAEELVPILGGVRAVDVMKKPIDKKSFVQMLRTSIGELSGARDTNATWGL
jgi:hypothetical protein